MDLHNAQTLSEFIELLKSEQGDSDHTLAAKIGVSPNTINRLRRGAKADDATLDKIADYAGVTRAWLYELAKGIPARPRYSRAVSMLIALLESAPPDVQENVLVMARALVEKQKKKSSKDKQDHVPGAELG